MKRDIKAAEKHLQEVLQKYVNDDLAVEQILEAKRSLQQEFEAISEILKGKDIVEFNIDTKLFLPKNSKEAEVIGIGGDQVVMRLNGGYVAKIPAYCILNDFYSFELKATQNQDISFPETQNYAILKEIGYKVAKHIPYTVELQVFSLPVCTFTLKEGLKQIDKKISKVSLNREIRKQTLNLAEDITYGGFEIVEIKDGNFSNYSNGKQVKAQYCIWKESLLDIAERKNNRYGLVVSGHTAMEGKKPIEAIEHMFIFAAKENKLKMVLGDLNHICFFYRRKNND